MARDAPSVVTRCRPSDEVDATPTVTERVASEDDRGPNRRSPVQALQTRTRHRPGSPR